MDISIAQEQLEHCTNLKHIEEQRHQQTMLGFATESFDNQLQELSKTGIGLRDTREEYIATLREYLLQFKKEIIDHSLTTADIDKDIKNALIKN